MAETGLTRSDALSFLTDVLHLHIQDPVLTESQKPDLSFLNIIIRTFMEQIPFQSITLIAQDLGRRHVPTWPEIKSAMFQKHGGVCHSLNAFMFFLLKSLGYDAILGYATAILIPNQTPADHIVIFVQGLTKSGDMYLVDVGFGNPSFEAVSLNFDVESPVYRHSYLEYKFFKQKGKIIRAHGKGHPAFYKDPEPWETTIGIWRGVYEFTTENIRPFEEFKSFYHNTYTTIDGFVFQRSLRAVSFPDGKAFAILHENILREESGSLLVKTHLPNDDELINAYLTHFPQFGENTVKQAVRNWRKQLENSQLAVPLMLYTRKEQTT